MLKAKDPVQVTFNNLNYSVQIKQYGTEVEDVITQDILKEVTGFALPG